MPHPEPCARLDLSGTDTGPLVAAAAHELKNPMEAMGNLLYLLEGNSTLDETGRKHVSLLRGELDRMRVIVAETLGLFRESAQTEAVALQDVLNAVVGFYAHKIRHKDVAVEKKYASCCPVEAVPAEIRQVFTNLVVNALEAVSPGGRVVLHTSTWHDGNHGHIVARVTIADDGPGIRPEHRKRIFGPFFTTKVGKGSGLGLWVSKRIVEKYGGSIRVRSRGEAGKSGTAFCVFLPGTRSNVGVPTQHVA